MRDRATVQCWSDMKQRCMNEAHPQYKNYGGRGIHICQRWLESVDNFITDMGVKPEGLTIEREDNAGNYEPSNCRWASRREQRANQRTTRILELDGIRKPLRHWAEGSGMSEHTLFKRIVKNGMSLKEALSLPTNKSYVRHGSRPRVADRCNGIAAIAAQGTADGGA